MCVCVIQVAILRAELALDSRLSLVGATHAAHLRLHGTPLGNNITSLPRAVSHALETAGKVRADLEAIRAALQGSAFGSAAGKVPLDDAPGAYAPGAASGAGALDDALAAANAVVGLDLPPRSAGLLAQVATLHSEIVAHHARDDATATAPAGLEAQPRNDPAAVDATRGGSVARERLATLSPLIAGSPPSRSAPHPTIGVARNPAPVPPSTSTRCVADALRVMERASQSECRLNVSYGCSRKLESSMWVTAGCRAIFYVGGSPQRQLSCGRAGLTPRHIVHCEIGGATEIRR